MPSWSFSFPLSVTATSPRSHYSYLPVLNCPNSSHFWLARHWHFNFNDVGGWEKMIWKSSFPYWHPVFTVRLGTHTHISLLFLASCLFPSSPLTPAHPPALSSPSSHLTNFHLIDPSWDRCWQHLRQRRNHMTQAHPNTALEGLGLSPLSAHIFSAFY